MPDDSIGTRVGTRKMPGFRPPMGPAPAPPFDPKSLITGAGGFWRADMGVTGSPNVTAWADQSSIGTNLTKQYLAGNDGSNATFSSTSFNTSFPGISFVSNAAVSLSSSTGSTIFPATSTASMFILFVFTATPSAFAQSRMVAFYDGGAGNIFTTPGFLMGSDTNAMQFFSNPTGELGNGGSELTAAASTNYLFGGVFDGAHANKWLNGTVQGSGTVFTSNLGSSNAGNQIVAGAPVSNGTNCAHTIAFWGITQKAMNSTDWSNLKTWSNSNWGTSF